MIRVENEREQQGKNAHILNSVIHLLVVQQVWRPSYYLSFPRMVSWCSRAFDQEASS